MCNCIIYLVIAELLRLAPTKSPQFDFGESGNLATTLDFIGAGDGTRTRDLLITNQLLYRLSYASIMGNGAACILSRK